MRYRMESRVRYSEADDKGRLTLPDLVDYLQDVATFHSEDTGFKNKILREKRMGWFILTWEIRLNEMPSMGENIYIDTWSAGYKSLMAFRDMQVSSTDGKVYADAHSIWTLMDLNRMVPIRVPQEMKDAYGEEAPLSGEWGPRKVPTPEDLSKVYDFRVSPMHLDTNHHMNNKYYVEAAAKCLPEDFKIGRIRVEYRKQAVLNDVVTVSKHVGDDMTAVALLSESGDIYSVAEFYGA